MTRRGRRIALLAHLLLGAAWTALLPVAGCCALATKVVHEQVRGLERREELDVRSVERLEVTTRDDGRLAVALDLALAGGERRSFELVEDWASGGARPELPVDSRRTATFVHLGRTDFAVGTPVRAVGPGGAVGAEERPLDEAARRDALLVMVTKGRDVRWYAWPYPPPAGGRPAGAEIASIQPWMRCPLLPPVTWGARAKQVALGVVGYPVAVAIDVVTWPLQAIAIAVGIMAWDPPGH